MADEEEDDGKVARNPLVIPAKRESQNPCCPYCGHPEFEGFAVQGVVTMKCRKCKEVWSGGLPQGRADPLQPIPPDNSVYSVSIEKSLYKNPRGTLPQGFVERVKPPDLRPDFRKGAPISDDEEL